MPSPRHLLGAAVLVTALVAGNASAQPARTPDFTPLAFLVGSCWKGNFPGGKETDEHCFEWIYDKKFIRDRHAVRGGTPYDGETIYTWDAARQKLTYLYIGSTGDVVTGVVEPQGDSIVFPSRIATPKGDVEIEAVWTRLGADAYRVRQRQKAAAGWKELFAMELKRQ
jgi:hypothetical protein